MSDTRTSGREMAGHPSRSKSNPAADTKPSVTRSLHGELIEQAIPGWLTGATPQRRRALKEAHASLPDWYQHASVQQRTALNDSVTASFSAQTRLDKVMAGLQDIDTFAAPLLTQALKDRFNVELDINKTFLQLNKPLEIGIFGIDVSHFEVLKLPLLQAALHNFEAAECEDEAFHASSGFQTESSTPGTLESVKTQLTVEQFTGLCRTLDIGAKYQEYLKDYLHPTDAVADHVFREKFCTAQKTALRAAAERALLQKDIEPRDYTSILSIIDGDLEPRQGNKQIWFRDLSLMKHRMLGCVLFSICEKYRYSDELILYIPNDPHHPLKRYTWTQVKAMFKQRFTARDGAPAGDGGPTVYQRFFSQFVAYADRPNYFSQFTVDTPNKTFSQTILPYAPLLNKLISGVSPFSFFSIKELPPAPSVPQVPNDDPYLDPSGVTRQGHGLWADNVDLWNYLFGQHRDRLMADARSHAVPTVDVDARVRSEKMAALLNIGMLVLTTVSMFVPVMGEVMMAVMAVQIGEEAFEGAIEWSEGDRKAAQTHLIDVAENLALLALMAGAGKGLAKLTAVKATPVIENLHSVTLPNGKTRLWKAELGGYESPVALDRNLVPNAEGQYTAGGKTYIKMEGKTYEQLFDPSSKRWRIKHPTDPQTYQPLLTHNGAGAWRHTLERPSTWSRLTLLRRMGYVTETYTDEQLLKIAEVSGVSDNALRKMHMDNALPPPELTDARHLFDADLGVARVIEQVATGQSIDARYLHTLSLVTDMPRWPTGRVLKVFDGPELFGPSVNYGAERLFPGVKAKAPIRISRADVLSGDLPARILAVLDESEITRLLGAEPTRVGESRPQELRQQIADFLRTRQPALFESLYKGTDPVDPRVTKLQRLCPGLSEPAAHTVLNQATPEELERLASTGRMPLRLQEQARWYAQQGRLSQAYAGLHRENMASADSKRLALHTLEQLPGWSEKVRLEIREGSLEGSLIDSIGSETAGVRKYLVKKGPYYQAFNDRGEALNSVVGQGDNFYSSIMHALPDEARQSLGLPGVGQSADLQRAIFDYAVNHPAESAQILRDQSPRKPWFKPPQRITENLRGYPASGRPGSNSVLISRVQDVYPDLTDEQSLKFLLEQWGLGKTDQQIFHLLGNRLREWQALESTLDQWAASEGVTLRSMLDGKRAVAQAIKTAWRNSPRAAENPNFASLDLFCSDPLPPLPADFSHVRELTVGGASFTDATSDGILGQFPRLKKLSINVTNSQLRTIPETLSGMTELIDLRITSNDRLATQEIAKLGHLTNLESLELSRVSDSAGALDVSRLSKLRSLTISNAYLGTTLPIGVLELPHLERLDLRATSVNSLPANLFDGAHDRLLSGLSLNWSWFTPETFKPIYEYVKNHPMHLIDPQEMVMGYCKGQLKQLGGGLGGSFGFLGWVEQPDALLGAFLQQWTGAEARFNAIETLGNEYSDLGRQLDAWTKHLPPSHDFAGFSAAATLKNCWYNGVLQRYGVTTYSSLLDLPLLQSDLLPNLPVQGFSHVTTLKLPGLKAPIEQVRRFVGHFSQTQTLDLSGSDLTEAPMTSGDLPGLQHLDLRQTRLEHMDVSAMSQLQTLDLSGTNLQAWPAGAENLPGLTSLDLRYTQITTLPESALARDEVLIGTHLTGTPLTPTASTALTAALARVELARGLSPGTLERFALEEVPQAFPPTETAASIAQHLLPLPVEVPAGEGTAWLAQRLQRLNGFSDEEALRAIEQLREEGTSDSQISERIGGWHQTLNALTRELNGWLFIRESRGRDWVVSSHDRRLAALRTIDCWRAGLTGREGITGSRLNFNGLQLGDLPELPAVFPHVRDLNLTGIRLTPQGSNGFLGAFTNLSSLALSGQALPTLPQALNAMNLLERLELSTTGFTAPENLYSVLGGHPRLKWLDLSHNNLQTFSVATWDNLEWLDVRNNRLTDWPEGALEAGHLGTLNLSNNEIRSIPLEAFDGRHDALMSGTDLTDNSLSRDNLQRLRDYAQSVQPNAWLGYSAAEIDELIDELGSDSESESESEDAPAPVVPDEVIQGVEFGQERLNPWLETLEPQVIATHRAQWEQLGAEPDNGAFFHLLAQLQNTQEYLLARADLTRRVWDVLGAAASDGELRQTLFGISNTHGTCVDGRILTFSNLEVKVFEHNALQGIGPGRLEVKGAALLRLSRQLFRLAKVEELANEKARGRRTDPAEVRLEYRIGLTSGWDDGLELPGQPRNMLYGNPLRGDALSRARAAVLERENKPGAFYEDLISRDYWVQYLKEKYPEAFSTLERSAEEKQGQLEDAHEGVWGPEYTQALESLGIELAIARSEKLIELSRKETGEVEPSISMEPQPGSSKDLFKPPSR